MLKSKIQNHHLTAMLSISISLSSACSLFDEMPQRPKTPPNKMAQQFHSPMVHAKDYNVPSLSHNLSSKFSSTMLPLKRRAILHLLRSRIRENDILTAMQLHSPVLKYGYSSDVYVASVLVDAYAKCGFVEDAHKVFVDISVRDLVLWNVMVSCYALNGLGEESLKVFVLMRLKGFFGDGFTFSSLLSACSSLGCCELGRMIHSLIEKLGLSCDVVVGSALVDMYAKCCEIVDARRAFDARGARNVVSWNAMIVGYGQCGEGKEAMKLLSRMIKFGFKPDELTLASILSSCAHIAATNETTQVHGYAVKMGFQDFVSIGNALIIAYAKNGFIDDAFSSFCLITGPDLVTWSSMVSSYAYHGLPSDAIDLFEKMLREGIRPDGVALLGVLSACSHAGLVEEGLRYFASMRNEYQISLNSEHYTCLVDLLGRANQLEVAYSVLSNMCLKPDADVLGAFIGACKVHGNTRLAKWAAEKLFKLQPSEPVNYKLMSNIYSSTGQWEDVATVRSTMRTKCCTNMPGFSWIEIGGTVRSFVSNDVSYVQASEIRKMLRVLVTLMKKASMIDEILMDHDLAVM
ncbi:pentatricopeptide repeat-containing protein At2g46050, mitochondrial-like [Ananas comosus]|uniref:Pentatricopeptide repeat-containing protein At2g46050, mitochondrial-like n=1 Tax=Ananas comosus TaxID=4615 RepID=A0A6P5EHW7_ANACO|nr:pentatricopeptide repeat-containing protein At2g46050, mitochondrial-like [Ananas comosus]XP_020081139.1 pentatricopeptide repeat-containing protein At2g46050, mitochondrial-like [Ananas comosus]XP_020081140.1 pentatricopeptide repeat-containing protein At2g46050, mitochondrial-like [Ananas comosus]XP_020081142.1 pentatricopeptide repeat-containing protein At2g46050, mitochondrial-like [Ananas comosus]XP_020081143.1 pentatricopeptide repeat-containing protein At2g46050, mitochondrial-like [A